MAAVGGREWAAHCPLLLGGGLRFCTALQTAPLPPSSQPCLPPALPRGRVPVKAGEPNHRLASKRVGMIGIRTARWAAWVAKRPRRRSASHARMYVTTMQLSLHRSMVNGGDGPDGQTVYPPSPPLSLSLSLFVSGSRLTIARAMAAQVQIAAGCCIKGRVPAVSITLVARESPPNSPEIRGQGGVGAE